MVQRVVPIDARASSSPPSRQNAFEYRYTTEFQSHEPEFDYLKSLEIEEKINQVRAAAPDACHGLKSEAAWAHCGLSLECSIACCFCLFLECGMLLVLFALKLAS